MGVTNDELITILREAVPPAAQRDYDPDEPLINSGLDSLDVSNFLLMIEERYGLKIPDEDVDRLNTLNDIRSYLDNRQR